MQHSAVERCSVCCKCGDSETIVGTLHARHKTYERLGQEKVEDLEVICQLCEGIWPQKDLTDNEVRVCDPKGWVDFHIVEAYDWNGYEAEAMDAWMEHRTFKAALRAFRSAKERDRIRKYANPERPALLNGDSDAI